MSLRSARSETVTVVRSTIYHTQDLELGYRGCDSDRAASFRYAAKDRFAAGDVENSLIEEVAAGEIDRATLIRDASMLGLAASAIGSGLVLFGSSTLDAVPILA